MTLLPPPALLIDAEEKAEEEVWYHNWMYSFVPASKTPLFRSPTWDKTDYLPNSALAAFLVGFCKICRTVFSAEVPVHEDGRYWQTPINVAKTGCVRPDRPF